MRVFVSWKLLWVLFAMFAGTSLASEKMRFRAHHMVLESVTDGKRIYAATRTGRIQNFNLLTGKQEKDLLRLPKQKNYLYPPTIFTVALSPGKKKLAAGTSTGEIYLFSTESNGLIKSFLIKGIENILIVRFLNDNTIVVGLLDGVVRLIQLEDQKERYRRKVDYAPVTNIRLSNNRQVMAVSTEGSIIRVLDVQSGSIIKELDGHKDTVYSIAFLDQNRLISGSRDGSLRLWNLAKGKSEILFQCNFFINSVAWNGENLIAFHSRDFQIGILDVTSKQLREIKGHRAFINTIQFLGTNRLLSSGNDARVIVNDL